jgi:hypothetical protein
MHDEALAVTLSVLVALTVAAFAVLAGTGAFGPSSAARETAPPPNCTEWTDGCVVCARTPGGLACSTPGIACTWGKLQCLKR